MQTIDHNTGTLAKATEIDSLEDLYVVVRRVPHNNGTLLHAYQSAEILVPLLQFIQPKPKGVKT